VDDFLVEVPSWQLRYLEVDAGHWFGNRRALVALCALGQPDWVGRVLPVAISQQQLTNSPVFAGGAQVSPVQLDELHAFFEWPLAVTGFMSDMGSEAAAAAVPAEEPAGASTGLRSSREVLHYHVAATDGEIGHVDDLIVDDEHWTIRYVVVNTQHWLFGRKVLIAPAWFVRVNWQDRRAFADLTRDAIRLSPQYDPATPVNRDYEGRLFDYYVRLKYWESTAVKTEFPCPDCGQKFFSRLELEDHRKQCGPGQKPKPGNKGARPPGSVISKIEKSRGRSSVGYREGGR
jgi:predicted RNA-binding Zn-ribbon protein involved in translation (DUF1610 family)